MTKFTRYQLRFQWHFDLPVYFSIAVIVSFCLAEDSFRQYLPGHLSRYQDRLGETKLTMRIPLPRLRKKANKELYCQHQNSIKYSWPSYNCPIDTKISLLIHNRRIQPTSYPTPPLTRCKVYPLLTPRHPTHSQYKDFPHHILLHYFNTVLKRMTNS